jgi:hypothetical protein
MSDFIGSHRLEYRTTAGIIRREPCEMLVEMAFHLPLRFDDEAETRPVAKQRGQRADGERAGVPHGIQQARAGVELLQAGLAPGEVIGFLPGSLEKQLASCRGARDQSLAMIKSLRGDFASVIYAHERSRSASFGFGDRGPTVLRRSRFAFVCHRCRARAADNWFDSGS